MRLLKTTLHPDVSPLDITPASDRVLITRHAARGIVIKGESILLLHTQRYNDYSLPGGGIDDGEDEIAGLKRELQEETGASGVMPAIWPVNRRFINGTTAKTAPSPACTKNEQAIAATTANHRGHSLPTSDITK